MEVRSMLVPEPAATAAKWDPHLLSLSRIRKRGRSPQGVASRNCWATQTSVGWAVVAALRAMWTGPARRQLDNDEDEERQEEEVVDLGEVTGPDGRWFHSCFLTGRGRAAIILLII